LDLSGYMTDGTETTGTYFHFYYTINPGPQTISIGFVADTTQLTGWAAFGFSNTGLMLNSDAAVAWVDSSGDSYVTDFILDGRIAPNPETCSVEAGACPDISRSGCVDSLFNETITRTQTFLSVQYTRYLRAQDVCDLAVSVGSPLYIVFAVGPVTSTGVWPYKAQYHYARTNVTLSLILLNTPTTAPTSAATSAATTVMSTTAIATTTSSTTGAAPPPTLTGYAYQLDFTPTMSNGFYNTDQYYQLYYTIASGTLSVGIVALNPDGWVAIGWSYDGYMATTTSTPSDAVILYVDTAGNILASDSILYGRYPGTNTTCPGNNPTGVCPDTSRPGCSNNAVAISGSRTGNYMTVEFTRPIAQSDSCDMPITVNHTQFIIYALGPVVQDQNWPYIVQFHSAHANVTQNTTFYGPGTPPATSTFTTQTNSCPIGTQGCPCTPAATCNAGLICSANICITGSSSSITVNMLLLFVLVVFSISLR